MRRSHMEQSESRMNRMEPICQILEKIINLMILRFQIVLFSWSKQTLAENFIDISLIFFQKMNGKSWFHII